MKGAGRRLSALLGRATRRLTAARRGLNRAKSLSYAAMSGGCAIVAYAVIDMSLSLALVGASFLATGVFARSMMGATKDISERLFDGQERIFDGQERILEAIQGPPQFDKDGKPVVKGNLMDKLDENHASLMGKMDENHASLMGKMDENHASLMGKMDELIDVVKRLSSSINRMSNNRP